MKNRKRKEIKMKIGETINRICPLRKELCSDDHCQLYFPAEECCCFEEIARSLYDISEKLVDSYKKDILLYKRNIKW